MKQLLFPPFFLHSNQEVNAIYIYFFDSADILFYSILPISFMYEKTLFLRDKNQPIGQR